MNKTLRCALILGYLLAGAAAGAAPHVRYHVTLVQPDGATQPLLGGINAAAHVAAAAIQPGFGDEHALLVDATEAIDLGTLGGVSSHATAINDNDVAVGTAANAKGMEHAFSWHRGFMTDLGALPGGIDRSNALAINGNGVVVGMSYLAGAVAHAFRIDAGVMTDLGVLPGAVSSQATGVNGSGHVVGSSGFANGASHAFILRDGAMVDLGTFGGAGSFSAASAINNADQVAGASSDTDTDTAGITTAFLWSNGTLANLGLPPDANATSSYARAINARGVVVGTFGRTPAENGLPQGAFVYDGQSMVNIEDRLDVPSRKAGWLVYSAMGINADGAIAALVWLPTDGLYRLAVLTPVPVEASVD